MTSMMSTIMRKRKRRRMMMRKRRTDRCSLERRSHPSPSSPVPTLSRSQVSPLLLLHTETQQEDAVICRHHPKMQAWNVVNLSSLTFSSLRSNKSNFSSFTSNRTNAPSHRHHARHPTVSPPQTRTAKDVFPPPPPATVMVVVTVDRASLPRH